jgi:AraC-like DNA-binding protein
MPNAMVMRTKSKGPPEELVRFRAGPLAGALQLSVENSTRTWGACHTDFAFTSVPLATRSVGMVRYRHWTARTVPGATLLMEPDTVHRTQSIEGQPASFKVLFVDHAKVEAILDAVEYEGPRHFRQPDCKSPVVCRAFRQVHELLEDDAADRKELEELFRSAVSGAFQASGEAGGGGGGSSDPTLVGRACEELKRMGLSDSPAGIDIAELARKLGSSYHWLIHRFTQELGVSPYQYYLRARLERVRRQLLTGPTRQVRTLTAVAAELGFSDLAHLDRQFSRAYGLTPSAFLSQLGLAERWRHRGS